MPTDQPSSAPDTLPADAADPSTAGAILHDEDLDDVPGGGGLGGAAAAAGAPQRTPSGTAPNAPIDVGVDPGDGLPDEGKAQAESTLEAGRADAPEPHPGSQ